MSIFFISGGEKKKVRHHKDVKMLQGVSYVIPKEMTGCPDQRFAFSKQKSIRFIKRNTVIDLELNKIYIWYMADSVKDFFKVSIRLAKPYIYNLKEIGDNLVNAFLKPTNGVARGIVLDDIPGNIISRSVVGMEGYNKKPSKLTYELAELLSTEDENQHKRQIESFDYWVFDQNMLDKGVVLTVGNDNGVEFIRYHVLASLQKGEDVITAYIRPCFCEEYEI